jgi:hypothetical protein
VHNLAYAQRLGLWGGADFPFATRSEFVEAIESGGVAAMEVLARDLKSLGLYTARSLSYEGVEYELIEHALTPEQKRIYDSFSVAFEVIHTSLEAALEATNITSTSRGGGSRTLNAQAKAAARSAFESAKQRFKEIISDCPSSWLSGLRDDHPQGSCPRRAHTESDRTTEATGYAGAACGAAGRQSPARPGGVDRYGRRRADIHRCRGLHRHRTAEPLSAPAQRGGLSSWSIA